MARVVRTFGGTTHMNFPTRCASLLSTSSTVATLVDVMVATVGQACDQTSRMPERSGRSGDSDAVLDTIGRA